MSGRHLRPDELVDLAEGARAESQAPHLQVCDVCRRQLAELRAVIAAAPHADVPEPSPLFWDHLSARVHDAVAAERAAGASWSWAGIMRPRALAVWAGALAALVLAAIVTMRTTTPQDAPRLAPPPAAVAADAAAPLPAPCCADDPALALVADLVRDMDYEDASTLAVTTHPGYADEAVSGLSTAEREELQRLIAAEMKRPGD